MIVIASSRTARTRLSCHRNDSGRLSKKKDALTKADNHKTSCALQCSKAGYGAVVNGKFVKFDKKGNELAKTALKATSKKDHLRATIDGEMKGDEIHVNSLKLD